MTSNPEIPEALCERLAAFSRGSGRCVALTGAGISAESGIPTFRGKEGYWVVGSREYQPEEMATHAMFSRRPEAVWAWYLYRRGVCRAAEPNAGHRAVVAMEELLGDRFLLITQNVDGLHLRAGSSLRRTYQIHGNVDFARCDGHCSQPLWPLPDALGLGREKGSTLTETEREQLRCPSCGGWARPHVLWFDECYDEGHFHFESSLAAADNAGLLLVVGTAGATNLPMQIGTRALRSGTLILDVNLEQNPFSEMAEITGGHFLQGPGATLLPQITAAMRA